MLRAIVGAWCAERGTTPVLVETEFAVLSVDSDRALLTPVLAAHPEGALVIGASPYAARAALDVLRALGRTPGGDVLVAACADEPVLLEQDPAVTAVQLPAHALGVACIERLVEILDAQDGAERALGTVQTIPAPVHLRASTSGTVVTR